MKDEMVCWSCRIAAMHRCAIFGNRHGVLCDRFYFVGDEDLLEIIGNSKNVPRLQKHFKKMFAGIHQIILDDEQTQVLGIASKEGEEVSICYRRSKLSFKLCVLGFQLYYELSAHGLAFCAYTVNFVTKEDVLILVTGWLQFKRMNCVTTYCLLSFCRLHGLIDNI